MPISENFKKTHMNTHEHKVEDAAARPDSTLSTAQQKLTAVWEEHMKCEFATKSVDDTMATMVEGGHVNHVPTMTGGQGLKDIRDFYTRFFIPQMPPFQSGWWRCYLPCAVVCRTCWNSSGVVSGT